MLTYGIWNDVLATCRLRNYDSSLTKKLSAITSKSHDETIEVSFPHRYELVCTLINEDQNPSSAYFIFEPNDSTPNILNFLAQSICADNYFWLMALCLFKLDILLAANVHKLMQQLQHCEQLFRAMTSLILHNDQLITPPNVEQLLLHASRSEAVSTILSQLVQKQGLFKPYATQKQWNALIQYPGDDADLVHLHKLFSVLFNSLNLGLFELALTHAPHAMHLHIIFNLLDKNQIDTKIYLINLIARKESLQWIAQTLQQLKLYQASLNERTMFFISLIRHGKQFEQFHAFFNQTKEHLLPPKLKPLFQLLFQYSDLLPNITRFFAAFNLWSSSGIKLPIILFIFRYRNVLFDIQLVQHLESVKPKFLTAERLSNLIVTCAHYEVEQTSECLNALLELIRTYHTPPDPSKHAQFEKRATDKQSQLCNADMRRYLKELDDNSHMKSSELDAWESDQFNCPISGSTLITPVRVGACPMVLDLIPLLKIKADAKGYRIHPGTRDGFLINEIIPARDVVKQIEQALKESKQLALSVTDSAVHSETDSESSSLTLSPV